MIRPLTFIAIVLLAVGLASCATHTSENANSEYHRVVAQIRNNHITWDGNYFGLCVRELGEPERKVLAAGASCRPFLMEALRDDSRYVAAHVLLTQMQKDSYPVSATEWNHLRIELLADGRAEIPKGQKGKIQRLWKKS